MKGAAWGAGLLVSALAMLPFLVAVLSVIAKRLPAAAWRVAGPEIALVGGAAFAALPSKASTTMLPAAEPPVESPGRDRERTRP